MRIKIPSFFLCFDVDHDHDCRDELKAELAQIRQLLTSLGVQFMATLSDLQAKVAANTSVTNSAVALIQGLKAKLDEAIASNDPNAIQALSDALDASDAQLAAAITANTPAAAGGGGGAATPPAEEPPTTTTDTGG